MAPSHSLPYILPTQPTNSPDFSLQMPNVFVVPPEEDQAPPWCCFDAAEVQSPQPPTHRLSTQPDMDSLQSRLNLLMTERVIAQGAPVFQRPASQQQVVMPKKMDSREASSASQEDTDVDTGHSGNDSVVVEVVKVGRNRKDGDLHPIEPGAPSSSSGNSLKRSTTLRLKAAKAFSSIRSLGKGTKLRKPTAKDAWAQQLPAQPPLSRAASFSSFDQDQRPAEASKDQLPQPSQSDLPALSRRQSIIVPQIPSPTIGSSPDERTSPSDSMPSSSASIAASSSQSTVASNQSVSPSLQLHRTPNANQQFLGRDNVEFASLSSQHSETDRLAAESQYSRPSSPSLTINTLSDKKSRRRFSMMSIRQIFTFTSTQSINTSIPNSESATSSNTVDASDSDATSLSESELGVQLGTPRLSRTTAASSSADSSDSSSGVETPTDEATFITLSPSGDAMKRPSLDWRIPELESIGADINGNFADGLGDLVEASSSKATNAPVPQRSTSGLAMDASFELQLDSLHFDSLSFDPESFNISEILKD